MSDLSNLTNDLAASWRSLIAEWSTTRQSWRDKIADRFEREFWEDLEREMPRLLEIMAAMDDQFNRADQMMRE